MYVLAGFCLLLVASYKWGSLRAKVRIEFHQSGNHSHLYVLANPTPLHPYPSTSSGFGSQPQALEEVGSSTIRNEDTINILPFGQNPPPGQRVWQ